MTTSQLHNTLSCAQDSKLPLSSKVSLWCLVIMMLVSMGAWPAWTARGYFLIFFGAVYVGIRLFHTPEFKLKIYDVNCIIFGSLMYIWTYLRVEISPSGIVSTALSILTILLLFWSSDREKQLLVKYTVNTFTIFLSIGILIFIPAAYLFINIPCPVLEYPHQGVIFYPDFRNYFFVIIPMNLDFYRFRGIFVEPGHLGMILSFLIYVMKFDYKKIQTWVMTIALIMTLSFAGYVLYIVALSIYLFMSSSNSVQRLKRVGAILSIAVILGIGAMMVPQDSIFYEKIVERAEFDKDKGLKGNNRNTASFEAIFDKFSKSPAVFTGASKAERENVARDMGNSSWQIFVYNNGLIGLAFVLVFYFNVILKQRSKLLWGMFFLYLISLIQRPYILWEMQIFLFVAAAGYFYSSKIKPSKLVTA